LAFVGFTGFPFHSCDHEVDERLNAASVCRPSSAASTAFQSAAMHRQRRVRAADRLWSGLPPASPSRPFRAADHLQSEAEVAAYIEAMLEDGDARAVPVALRTVAESVGGMTALARKTGLSRETLYRTLSKRGNPRLDTLAAILAAFGLRLTVRTRSGRAARGRATVAPA